MHYTLLDSGGTVEAYSSWQIIILAEISGWLHWNAFCNDFIECSEYIKPALGLGGYHWCIECHDPKDYNQGDTVDIGVFTMGWSSIFSKLLYRHDKNIIVKLYDLNESYHIAFQYYWTFIMELSVQDLEVGLENQKLWSKCLRELENFLNIWSSFLISTRARTCCIPL